MQKETLQPSRVPVSVPFDGPATFVNNAERSAIALAIDGLRKWRSIWFNTSGAWSNISLLENLLELTGPADIYFSTWAINEQAITRMMLWQEAGRIREMYAVIDTGLRNRKPAVYQRAVATFTNLKIAHCHAKALVVISDTHKITLTGSANFTENLRIEVGVLSSDEKIAEANKKWILEVINGTA